jgi:hypothetical protein
MSAIDGFDSSRTTIGGHGLFVGEIGSRRRRLSRAHQAVSSQAMSHKAMSHEAMSHQSVENPDRTRRFDLDQNAQLASAIGSLHNIAVRDGHDRRQIYRWFDRERAGISRGGCHFACSRSNGQQRFVPSEAAGRGGLPKNRMALRLRLASRNNHAAQTFLDASEQS